MTGSTLFVFLTAGINAELAAGQVPGPADYNMMMTAQPFALPAGETRTVAFAFVMGGDLAELVSNLQATEAAYSAASVGVDDPVGESIPTRFALDQNYPNPFNPSTTISYSLPRNGNVDLGIFDVLGKRVHTLVSGPRAAGNYEVSWDASGVASGLYFYRLTSGANFSDTKSLVILK